MRIKIIQIGKTKEKYIEKVSDDFVKILKPFANIEIITLKEVKISKTFLKEKAIQEEGEEILKNLKTGDFIVALDENGKEFRSKEFSEILKKHRDSGSTLCFIIGGPYGLNSKVKEKANLLLSMSKMTFTHQMIRMFLLEQIYRGVCIIHGKEYHNE